MNPEAPLVRRLGRLDFGLAWQRMQAFTAARDARTRDEIWLTEHPPVFTLGRAGRAEHLLAPGDIPVVWCDRGGQVTYHGPGQLLVYCLVDLKRRRLGVKDWVAMLEQAVICWLADHQLQGSTRAGAPGVYVGGRKLASLGLRVQRGCCYHGLALNGAMDLTPFQRINPCGQAGLEVTSLEQLGTLIGMEELGMALAGQLMALLEHPLTPQDISRCAPQRSAPGPC